MGKAVRISVSLAVAAGMLVCFCFSDVWQASGAGSETVTFKKGVLTEEKIIKDLQSRSDKYLRNKGYTQDQIKAIKACDPKGLSGKVTYRIGYKNFRSMKVKSKNGKKKYWITRITTVARWKWVKKPFFSYKDIYGVTTSDRFVKESSKGTLIYYQLGDRKLKKKKVKAKMRTNNTGRGVYTRFPAGRQFALNEGYKWKCMNGTTTTKWIADGKIDVVGLASNYGHSVLELNPTVSFSGGASITFRPYISTKYGDEAFVRARK